MNYVALTVNLAMDLVVYSTNLFSSTSLTSSSDLEFKLNGILQNRPIISSILVNVLTQYHAWLISGIELCRFFSTLTSRELDNNGSTQITKHANPSAVSQ